MTTSIFFKANISITIFSVLTAAVFSLNIFNDYIFSYDYGAGDYGGFFGSGFPSLFGAPRVRVVVVPVDEV